MVCWSCAGAALEVAWRWPGGGVLGAGAERVLSASSWPVLVLPGCVVECLLGCVSTDGARRWSETEELAGAWHSHPWPASESGRRRNLARAASAISGHGTCQRMPSAGHAANAANVANAAVSRAILHAGVSWCSSGIHTWVLGWCWGLGCAEHPSSRFLEPAVAIARPDSFRFAHSAWQVHPDPVAD